MTVSSDFFKGLAVLGKNTATLKNRSIVYCGDRKMMRQGVDIIPWNQIDGVFCSGAYRSGG